MAKWKEILANPKAYGDDFTVTLKDGQTLTLGEMRAYDRENEGELTKKLTAREEEIGKREKNVRDASVNLVTVIEQTAQRAGLSVEEFMAGKAPTKKAVAESAELDENDPLVGTLVKQIKTLQTTIEGQGQRIEELKKNALGPMLNTYLEDYYETQWEKISPTLPEGAKLDRQQVMDYAQKEGLLDAKKRLDLRKAVKELTYDARVQAEAKKLATIERKKMDDEAVLRAAPRPSTFGTKIKTDKSLLNEKGQTKNFDEVLNDALSDTDLWKGITTTQ